MSKGASATEMADAFESGNVDLDHDVPSSGGSGKNRSKAEQQEHKHAHKEGDTRKIVNNIKQGEENRKEEALKKQ